MTKQHGTCTTGAAGVGTCLLGLKWVQQTRFSLPAAVMGGQFALLVWGAGRGSTGNGALPKEVASSQSWHVWPFIHSPWYRDS